MTTATYILVKPEHGEPMRALCFNSSTKKSYPTLADGVLKDTRIFKHIEFYDGSTASLQGDGRYKHNDTGKYYTVVNEYPAL